MVHIKWAFLSALCFGVTGVPCAAMLVMLGAVNWKKRVGGFCDSHKSCCVVFVVIFFHKVCICNIRCSFLVLDLVLCHF